MRYNRFRYYDAEEGVYLSQDPIGLAGGNPTLYGYVGDVNGAVDVFGLNPLLGLDFENMSRPDILNVVETTPGIEIRGGSPDGKFMQFNYSDTKTFVARIDPPDDVTSFDHIHLYDKAGNSLDKHGKIVNFKSPDAHIKIKPPCQS